MSAEMITSAAPPGPAQRSRPRRGGPGGRAVAGVLGDGTPFYAPIGEVTVNGALVVCHLCGRSLRSVTVHLRVHGWTKAEYCEAFGLERDQPLEGPETRKLRAAAFASRLVFEPAVRDGSAAGRARARAGELARAAASAAQGRPFPEQRRRKAAAARAAIAPGAIARANSERARLYRARVASDAARRHGYPDIGAFVRARTADGASLAAISREAGLHKDWLSRHLADVDPAVAEAALRQRAGAWGSRLLPSVRRLGFTDVRSYLRDRHIDRHMSVNSIAAEAGLSYRAVEAALRRLGLDRTAHAATRHAARERAARVAGKLGFASIPDYVGRRRAMGWTWQAIAAESGQPQSWLRRQARPANVGIDASPKSWGAQQCR